ncbi:hypothetical protein ACGFRG_05820 [Streptomyces sp. NPDC048696]|uniref:hypothetical protein n=1 Tax=Streptomyces sp. NPDC048696 TaxID=3365585 RepID=UPI003718913C
MEFPRLGLWAVELHLPEHGDELWTYLISGRIAATEDHARTVALRRHKARELAAAKVSKVTLRPALRSRERAVAWAALHACGAVRMGAGWTTPDGAIPPVDDDDWWARYESMYTRYRAGLVGFGDHLSDILEQVAGTAHAIELAPYTDKFGRVDWDAVRTDIWEGGLATVRQTPYGTVLINHG